MSVSAACNLISRNKNSLQHQKCVVVTTYKKVNNECAISNYSKVFEKNSNWHVYNELYKSLIKL